MRTITANGGPKSVLDRAFTILDTFGPDDTDLSLAELVDRSRLPKSTAHRIAGSLVQWRALERVGDRYRLGTRLFEWGELVPRQRRLRETAIPFMEDLYEASHETVNLATLDNDEVLYLAKIGGHRQLTAPSRAGGRLPAHATALGKVLLAFGPPEALDRVLAKGLRPRTPYTITVEHVMRLELAQVAKRGFAIDREESATGITCAAAPVFERASRVVAALSVSGPVSRCDPDRWATGVRTAALGLHRALTGQALAPR